MKSIDGNIELVLKRKSSFDKNEIGENVPKLVDYMTFKGFLDMANTNTTHAVYNAKMQDSTHYFICDYKELETFIDDKGVEKKPRIDELVAYCNDKEFDVLWVDNPMELNYHLEFYLEYKGV